MKIQRNNSHVDTTTFRTFLTILEYLVGSTLHPSSSNTLTYLPLFTLQHALPK